jgi:hypothetical protein
MFPQAPGRKTEASCPQKAGMNDTTPQPKPGSTELMGQGVTGLLVAGLAGWWQLVDELSDGSAGPQDDDGAAL